MEQRDTNGSGKAYDFEQEYAKLSERERILPSGFKVRFRALGIGEWVAIWKGVPSLIRDNGVVAEIDTSTRASIIAKTQRCVIEASVAPKFRDEPAGKSDQGFMSVNMLSDQDLADYLTGISEALGFGTKKAEVAADVVNA